MERRLDGSHCVRSFYGTRINPIHGVTRRVVPSGLCSTAPWRRISRPCSGRFGNKMNRDMAYPSTLSRSSGSTFVAEFLAMGSPASHARPAVAQSSSHFRGKPKLCRITTISCQHLVHEYSCQFPKCRRVACDGGNRYPTNTRELAWRRSC